MEPDEVAKLFHEGVALFNEGDFFEAHEVWEDIWHMASGDLKRFYQGLIQCAVTIEHLRRGNPRGVVNVFKSAQTKFVGLPTVYHGVNIPGLIAEVKRMIQPVLDLPPEAFDPALPHGRDFGADWDHPPKLVLEYDPFADVPQ